MDLGLALVVVVALVALATTLGLVGRSRAGRLRRVAPDRAPAVAELGLDDGALGAQATLVQYSTEFCTQCPPTRRLLGELASSRPGVHLVDVDLTHRPELARALGILQTPTVLVLDAAGSSRARIGGLPRRLELEAELDSLVRSSHAA